MMRRRHRAELALAGVGLLALVGWLDGRLVDVGGRPLVEMYGNDPGTFDLQSTSAPIAEAIARRVFEPLFYEDEDGQIRGLLAEDAVDTGVDGTEVRVRLRPGIHFHDGRPLDGTAVVASFGRLQRLGRSPLTENLRGVVVAPGPEPLTVDFRLPKPNFEFVPLVLANPYAAIVAEPGGAAQGEGSAVPGGIDLLGTGPFGFLEDGYVPGGSLALGRFAGYRWPPAYAQNRGAPFVPRFEYRFLTDRAERLKALLAGEGCVLSLSREHVATVEQHPELRRYETLGGVTYLGFNFQRKRWQDPRLRQAVAMAVDRTALAATGPYTLALTPLVPTARGYDPSVAAFGYPYDPEQSRALLAALGPEASGDLVLLAPEGSTYGAFVELVEPMLRAVGFEHVTVRRVARDDISAMRQDFDLLLYDYAWGDYTALGIFLGPGPRNLLGYGDPRVHDLVDRALATRDPAERHDYVVEAQRQVLGDALWQPLVIPRLTIAVASTCVSGERQAPDGTLEWQDAVTSGG